MTYEKFIQEVQQLLQARLPQDISLVVQPVLKNNHQVLDGLLFTSPSTNISPTLYLNSYYDSFQQGESLSDICDHICKCYENAKWEEKIDLSFFQDFSKVADSLILKLIHTEKNKELLEQIPHIPYLDLSIVFCYFIPAKTSILHNADTHATILIQNSHLNMWKINTETLYQHAKENTPRLFPTKIFPLTELFGETATDSLSSPPLYVITNPFQFLGATALLYPDTLSRCEKLIEDDFYIIPSSIHELIVLPQNQASSKEYLTALIQEVNQHHVATEEILSDHPYFYSHNTKKIQF